MMYISQVKILYKLFFKSSNLLLKLSIFFLPFIMAISFSALFFINNLSQSYKNYLLESYIGTQGVLSVKSDNQEYLFALQKKLSFMQIDGSLKNVLRRDMILKTSQYTLEKKIKFIILESSYLKKKFNSTTLVINTILKNILLSSSTLFIKHPKATTFYTINDVKSVDTGFLSSEPLIFITKEMFEKLGYRVGNYQFLELGITLDQIAKTKEVAYELSEEYGADIEFIDILSAHQETQTLFDNIHYIELLILWITILLSFIILSASLGVIAKIKEKAITLLRVYGLSTQLISLSLMFLSIAILSISIILAYILFVFMKEYFIISLDLHHNFFIPLDGSMHLLVSLIFIVFTSVTYIWAYKTFKGKITL